MVLPRFYPILDLLVLTARGYSPLDAAAEMLDLGVRLMQFRNKAPFTPAILELLERISERCRQANAVLVVNDRADVAALLEGAGVHLGQEDLTPEHARKVLTGPRLIGYSTHNESQLREAQRQDASYYALGPVFATSTKADADPVIGVDAWKRLRPISTRPLVAIGGITRGNAAAVLEAGADSLAVIGDVFPEEGSRQALQLRLREWLRLTA